MASAPKELMFFWTSTLAMEMTDIWTPVGRPMRMISLSSGPSILSSLAFRV